MPGGWGVAVGENEELGGEETYADARDSLGVLVCGRWKSSYSQPHNGTLTARIIALGIKKELAVTLTPCLFGGP